MGDRRFWRNGHLCRSMMMWTVFVSAGMGFAQESPRAVPLKGNPLSVGEVKDKQLDVSLETRDIERVLGKLKKASDLARQRITEAAEITEAVSVSLNKGDAGVARNDARQATEKFKEIVKQLEALLKEEAPQQIAEAQQLATRLARLEREFAEKFEGVLNPVQVMSGGETKIDPKSQTRPKMDPDVPLKGKGAAEGKQGSEKKPTGDRSQPKEDPESKNGASSDESPADRSSDGSGDEQANSKEGAQPKEGERPNGGGDSDQDDEKNDRRGSDSGQKAGDDPKKSAEGGSSGRKDEKKTEQQGTGDSDDRSGERPKTNGKGERRQTAAKDESGSGTTEKELRDELGRQADRLAETGKTLQDVLNAIARSENPADKEAAAKIQQILKEMDVSKIVQQMEGTNGLIRGKKDREVKLSSLDLAERFEILSQRLDTAYRAIVVPQAEELRKLELALIELREKLEELETPSQVLSWHREVRELLERSDQLGVSQELRTQFEDELRKGGFAIDRDPTRRDLNWGLVNDRYVAPGGYMVALTNIQEDVQNRIQTLLLGDMGRMTDDAAPPAYQGLVDRYYQVLSGDTGKESKSSAKTMGQSKGK